MLRPSPKGKFVALTDGASVEVYLVMVYQFFHISLLTSSSKGQYPAFTWLTDGSLSLRHAFYTIDSHLIAGFGSELALYHIDSHKCTQLSFLDGIDPESSFGVLTIVTDDSVEYVLGVTIAAPVMVYLWKVNRDRESNVSITLFSKKPLPLSPNNQVRSIQPVNFFERRQNIASNVGPYLFVTFLDDGDLKFWQHGWKGILADEDSEWIEVLSVTLPAETNMVTLGRIGYISTGNSNFFKTYMYTVTKEEGGVTLTIWESNPKNHSISKVWNKFIAYVSCQYNNSQSSGSIISMDWFLTAHGIPLLAVGSLDTIAVFCPRLLTSADQSAEWSQIYTNRRAPDDTLILLKWLANGRLFLSTQKRNVVIEKFYHQGINQGGESIDVPEESLFEVASHFDGMLPNYHPVILMQYLIWSKYLL